MRNTSTWPAALAVSLALLVPVLSGMAQADRTGATAPSTRSRTRLITLGTAGGPLPQKDRTQSSNLLLVDDTPYLVDAGDNVTRRIVQAGSDFRKIGTVFLTHNHSDHTMGLATLLASQWEYQRREPIDIYGPRGTNALVSGATEFLRVNAEIRWAEGKRVSMPAIFHSHEVLPGLAFQDTRVTVTAVENTHYNLTEGTPPYGKHQSYSYRFDTPDRAIVFTGDTGLSDAVIALARHADVLVTEVTSVDDTIALFKQNGAWTAKTADEQKAFVQHLRDEHMTPEDVGRMAARAGVKMVVMTHISPTVDPEHASDRYVELARRSFSGRIVMARDLMEF